MISLDLDLENLLAVALNLCNGLHGFIQSGSEGYVITPARQDLDWSIESEHEIKQVQNIPRTEMIQDAGRRKRGIFPADFHSQHIQ